MTTAARMRGRVSETNRERVFLPVADALAGCTGPDGQTGPGPRGSTPTLQDQVAHGTRGGSLDESARRLSHEELRAAHAFAAEGHNVISLPERAGRGRTADLEVCGRPVEVKSWLSLADRHGVTPTRRSVVNKLISAEGQSGFVVLVANGSGLSPADAMSGLAQYASERPWSSIRTVRLIGDGFDLSWQRSAGLIVQPSRRRAPSLGIGV